MNVHCHRCGSAIASEDSFCASCGAPQLRFASPGEEQLGLLAAEGQGTRQGSGDHRTVDWRKAFQAALSVALPVGILTALPGISLGFLLWVIGGSVAVIALYQRRRPGALLDGRSGFRIGALTGLLAAYVSTAAFAALQLMARYQLRLGGLMDKEYALREEQVVRWTYSLVQSSAETEAQMRAQLHFLLTPDGRAATSIANAATTAIAMILFAGIGGLLGVRMFGRQQRAL